MAARPTICLNMIVKDEAPIITRCLDSVIPFVDHWVIVDTGSTDGTQAVIREHMRRRGIPGELFERPWKNFGHNRTEALGLARDRADYTFVIDADDVLELPEGWPRPALVEDAYMVRIVLGQEGTTSLMRTQLVRSALPWRYKFVLHEVLTCPQAKPAVPLPGVVVRSLYDGHRNRDARAKYAADAEVLARAVEEDPDNARYWFYLGQSYKDCGELDASLRAYERRIELGGWPEEVWYSILQIARIHHQRQDWPRALEAYLRAHAHRPRRAEPLVALAAHCRRLQQWPNAMLFAERAAALARPADLLMLDESVYAWRARDELAIAAYWVGDYARSERLCADLLASEALPATERARVEKNRQFSLDAQRAEGQGPT